LYYLVLYLGKLSITMSVQNLEIPTEHQK